MKLIEVYDLLKCALPETDTPRFFVLTLSPAGRAEIISTAGRSKTHQTLRKAFVSDVVFTIFTQNRPNVTARATGVGDYEIDRGDTHCIFYVCNSYFVAYTFSLSYNVLRLFVKLANEKSGGYHGTQAK